MLWWKRYDQPSGAMILRLPLWWRRPDHFDWVTTFLRQRKLIRSAQMILAIVSASAAWVPLTVLATQRRPSAVAWIISAVAVVFSVGSTYFWLTHWPTRRQSQFAAVTGMLSAGGWSVVQPNPTLAALACTALAVTGGYIALFHNLRLLALNSLVAMVAATDSMLRLAGASDSTAAVTAFWLICFPNFSVPLIIWGMSQAVESYVQRAQQDPLTGLLNRRAFAEAVAARLVNHPAAHTCLAVMMVDLDNFKHINDTHGHAAGDRLLQAVAELLRDQSPPEAIICRAGGEEFLLAATCTPDRVATLAPPLCRSIAEHPSGITASIGTASADLGSLGAPGGGASLDELIAAADRAMYAAKRRGGNQARDFG